MTRHSHSAWSVGDKVSIRWYGIHTRATIIEVAPKVAKLGEGS